MRAQEIGARGWCRATCAATSLVLAGCVALAEYPSDWPRVDHPKSGDCAALSGLYDNHGWRVFVDALVGTRPTHQSAELGSYFAVRDTPLVTVTGEAVRQVRLDADTPGRLTITLIMAGGDRRSHTFDEAQGGVACIDGRLRVKRGEFGAAYVALGVGEERYWLSKARDGSLVVEENAWIAGTAMLVIPIGGGSRSWARFEAARD